MTMLNSILLVILMFVSSLVLAEEIVIENLPSAEVKDMFNTAPEAFSDLASSLEQRVSLLSATWSRANRSSPIDNRAYLYALAIDLYNSLPADVRPQPRELGPEEDAYPPAMEPFKLQSFYSMRIFDINRLQRLDEKISSWNYMKKNFDPKRLNAAAESTYATEYLQDQIVQGNIVFDVPDAPASLPPEKLDITNPTYYKPLREYMERMQPAIEAGVPPWEAEKYLAMEQGDEQTKPKETVKPSPAEPVAEPIAESASQPANTTIDPYASDEAQLRHLVLIIALLAIGLAVIFYIIRRPRKK